MGCVAQFFPKTKAVVPCSDEPEEVGSSET